jgi:SpoVK/Ycf46/Vps4 family AAA+-type ATPase
MSESARNWYEDNQRFLTAALAALSTRLKHASGSENLDANAAENVDEIRALMSSPPALDVVADRFNLTDFEKDVLLLSAAIELDSRFAALCALLNGDTKKNYVTFSLCLAALPDAHWSALLPVSSLRRWHMIELNASSGLTSSPLRIDERILHYIAGLSYVDERLQDRLEPLDTLDRLPPSQSSVARDLSNALQATLRTGDIPVFQITGSDAGARKAIVWQACTALGLQPFLCRGLDLPRESDRGVVSRLLEREARLQRLVLVIDVESREGPEIRTTVIPFVDRFPAPLIIFSREPVHVGSRRTAQFEVTKPTADEQHYFWERALGPLYADVNGELDAIVSQFSLGVREIQNIARETLDTASDFNVTEKLWQAALRQTRPRLDDLAQRIHPNACWDDLVLPATQKEILFEIAAHVRHRHRVYNQWGFASRSSRGLGVCVLFEGASGTGKTMAAEVLAKELKLDLYRIDLSSVVSKYIGETEKNLKRVFDAAEDNGAILLFDEADALFGKRSEVKDSHDRYANVEISYLLQRMEAHRGLAILTTNIKDAVDTAFLRRIRFVIHFPFPDASMRAAIWSRVFPSETPTDALDVEKLARLGVSGGNIRNIAMNAAFRAADAQEPVRMTHLFLAARTEYLKIEKPLTEVETGGWL